MKKFNKKLLFLLYTIFIILIFFNFAFAQEATYPEIRIPLYIQWFYPTEKAPITLVLISIIIFFMLAFAFSEIIRVFTMFSTFTSAIIGTGLAIIAALTRVIFWLSFWIFQFTAGLGVIAIAIILITAFVAAIGIHLAFKPILRWTARRHVALEAIKEAKSPATAWKKLEEFEKMTKS